MTQRFDVMYGLKGAGIILAIITGIALAFLGLCASAFYYGPIGFICTVVALIVLMAFIVAGSTGPGSPLRGR